jgi:hypothetical protein
MLILTVAAVAVIVGADGIGDRVLKWAHPTSELVDGTRFIAAAWIVLILIGSAPSVDSEYSSDQIGSNHCSSSGRLHVSVSLFHPPQEAP